MNQKVNRCCKLLQTRTKNNSVYHHIGIQEKLEANDLYMWKTEPNNIFSCIQNTRDITRLNNLMEAGKLFKIIASTNENLELFKIPFNIIEEYYDKLELLDNKLLTIKYTYDIIKIRVSTFQYLNERINYRPKIDNNKIYLNIFQTRTKKYH